MNEQELNERNLTVIEKIGNKIFEMVEEKDVNFIDACIILAEEHDVDYDVIATVVERHQQLKEKIRKDAEDLHFIKKEGITTFEYE